MKTNPDEFINSISVDGLTSGGLTKREHFVIEIAKAIESKPESQYQPRFESEKVAQRAIKLADLLIAELNKKK